MSFPKNIKIVLATRNEGKIREIKKILEDLPVAVVSLAEFPPFPEVEEPHDTYLENAREKARAVARHCGTWALADDSGLEVEALGGRPGVLSARYAGENVTYADNNQKLLKELDGIPPYKRKAVFRCCMVLKHPDGRECSSEGELWGTITMKPRGEGGFGYDPVFEIPTSYKTLAELSLEEKNRISHRTRALRKMKEHIGELISQENDTL